MVCILKKILRTMAGVTKPGYINTSIPGLSLIVCLLVCECMHAGKTSIMPDLSRANWLIAGPFDNPQDRTIGTSCIGFDTDYLTGIGGETGASPLNEQTDNGIVWRKIDAEEGRIDFNRIFGYQENKVAYAFLQFSCSQDYEAALKLGSDDGIKVFLNGRLIFYNHIHRALVPGQDAVPVLLQKGINQLLIKIGQATGGWEFSALFHDKNQDEETWRTVRQPHFRIIPGPTIVSSQEPITCSFSTEPAFAVSEPIHVSLHAEDGSLVTQADTFTGKMFSFQPETGSAGLMWLQAEGQGRLANLSQTSCFIYGDYKHIVQDIREQTTKALAKLQSTPMLQGNEEPSSTLAFHLQQIEGRLPVSLMQNERIVRSLFEMSRLSRLVLAVQDTTGTFKPGSVRGYNQWAYRSVIDKSLQPYSLYVPESYNPQKTYSLIITLHGHSMNDYDDGNNVASLKPEDFLILSCFGRGDMGYQSAGEQDVLDTMNIILHSYAIDPDRVYLMGWSMGGFGTWRLGQFYADRFAALAPFCGWTGTKYLDNLRNIPVRIVHGNQDNSVPIDMEREAAGYLKQKGYDVTYEELNGAGHNAWSAWIATSDGRTMGGNKILEYFRKYRRNPWPKHVTFTTDQLRYNTQYWVKIDELAAAPAAGFVDAWITDPGHIEVKTEGVSAFTLDLSHPGLQQTGQLNIVINNNSLQTATGGHRTFTSPDGPDNRASANNISGTNWRVTADGAAGTADSFVRAPHTYGGLKDLFLSPLLIVYGTRSNQNALQKIAEKLADWSPTPTFPVGMKLGSFIVKADKAVTEDDLGKYNLLLIGKEEENILTARWAQRLPVRISQDSLVLPDRKFKREKNDSPGFMLAYPNPDNQRRLLGVIILPANFAAQNIIDAFLGSSYGFRIDRQALSGMPFPDVKVFDSSGLFTIWQGSFDKNWSKLKPWS